MTWAGCQREDLMLILSQSGETEEIVRLFPSLAEVGVPMAAITGRASSTLGRAATVTIELGPLEEACSLGLAPSTSTTAMMAVGDALALVVSRMRRFSREDFARFHPGGSLGYKLSKVEQHMRPLEHCRLAAEDADRARGAGRRQPAAAGERGPRCWWITEGKLAGIFTDSDFARLFEHRRDGELDGPIAQVMTRDPLHVQVGSMMVDAVNIMAARKISELPVIDADGKPVGLVDITDVVALLPSESSPDQAPPAAKAPWRVVGEPPQAGA